VIRLVFRCASRFAVLLLLACLGATATLATGGGEQDWFITSAGEVGGKLQIVLRNGRVFRLPRKDFVCSYDGVTISPDGLTVGWVEGSTAQSEDQKPCDPGAQYVAGGPVFWRAGRVLRDLGFGEGEILWSFVGGGDRIACMPARPISTIPIRAH